VVHQTKKHEGGGDDDDDDDDDGYHRIILKCEECGKVLMIGMIEMQSYPASLVNFLGCTCRRRSQSYAGETKQWLNGLEHVFFHILGIIIPTDFHIFQRG